MSLMPPLIGKQQQELSHQETSGTAIQSNGSNPVAKIDTLVEDIEKLLVSGIEVPPNILEAFGSRLAKTIADRLFERTKKSGLRMSNIGKPCLRQLYYEVNSPEDAIPLKSEHYLKFLYGDIIEELVLFLAELAGHEVKGRQDEQEIEGIKGHRDAIIDGTLVDVKSASTYSFKKFKQGELAQGDSFGYIPQLQSYLHAGQDDDAVKEKARAAFLVVDKTLGHIHLDTHEKDQTDWPETYKQKKEAIAKNEVPERGFSDEPMGQSGNRKLGFNCSYCPFVKKCWPGVRTFLYSYGPVMLTEVHKEPLVPELKEGDNDPDT